MGLGPKLRTRAAETALRDPNVRIVQNSSGMEVFKVEQRAGKTAQTDGVSEPSARGSGRSRSEWRLYGTSELLSTLTAGDLSSEANTTSRWFRWLTQRKPKPRQRIP
jgi:hypothetical protein